VNSVLPSIVPVISGLTNYVFALEPVMHKKNLPGGRLFIAIRTVLKG